MNKLIVALKYKYYIWMRARHIRQRDDIERKIYELRSFLEKVDYE